jgi:hypothetical protein
MSHYFRIVRSAFILILTVAFVAPLAAQAPAGWEVRIDKSTNASDPDDVPEVKVATVGKGFRVTGGPAGTYWNPANTAKGNYTVRANFNLMKPSGHVNYYGIVFGGSDLNGVNQQYLYFLVAQNGSFIIRQRTGDKVGDVVSRTMPHPAVRLPGADGMSMNALEVRVGATQIEYVVNGMVVHTTPKTGLTAQTDGIAGVRVNHQLDVTVDGFQVQQ